MRKERIVLIAKGLVISSLLFSIYWPVISQSVLFLLVFPCTVYFTFCAFEKKRYILGLFYLAVSYIFNPVQPIALPDGVWILINTSSVILIFTDLMWWYLLNYKIIDLYNKGEYKKAQCVAEKAFNVAKHTFGINHFTVARSLNDLLDIYKELGKTNEAVNLTEDTLRIWEKTKGQLHPDVIALEQRYSQINAFGAVKMLPNYAILEENKTKLNESIDRVFTEDYLNIDESKENPDKLARKLVNKALFFAEQNEEDKAQEILECAISIWDKADKKEKEELVAVASKLESNQFPEPIKFDIGELQSPECLSFQEDINSEINKGINEIYDLNSGGMESVVNTDFYELQGTKNKLTQFEIQNAICAYAESSKKAEANAFYWPLKSKKSQKGKVKSKRIKYLVGF